MSSSSSSRPSSVTSHTSVTMSTGSQEGFPFFPSTEFKLKMNANKAETRPRHELMRLRRTSMPAVPTTSFLSHSLPPARSISNGPHPSAAIKRMSTASIQSFESLAEETAESLDALTMYTLPLSASTSSLALNDALSHSSRKPLLRRTSPSYLTADRPASISISPASHLVGGPSTSVHRLSLPEAPPLMNRRSSSPKKPPRANSNTAQIKLRGNHPRKGLKRSVTEPAPFS